MFSETFIFLVFPSYKDAGRCDKLRHYPSFSVYHVVLTTVSPEDILRRKPSLRLECWTLGSSFHTSDVDKLFRSFLNMDLLRCLCSSCLSFSLKKLVVNVYRMGFSALLIGKMNITIQEVTVPAITRK